jgi:hypothetical protein
LSAAPVAPQAISPAASPVGHWAVPTSVSPVATPSATPTASPTAMLAPLPSSSHRAAPAPQPSSSSPHRATPVAGPAIPHVAPLKTYARRSKVAPTMPPVPLPPVHTSPRQPMDLPLSVVPISPVVHPHPMMTRGALRYHQPPKETPKVYVTTPLPPLPTSIHASLADLHWQRIMED